MNSVAEKLILTVFEIDPSITEEQKFRVLAILRGVEAKSTPELRPLLSRRGAGKWRDAARAGERGRQRRGP